jgi:hypothetical protein
MQFPVTYRKIEGYLLGITHTKSNKSQTKNLKIMPDGTIQDSRSPTSPQFGYLRIKPADLPAYGTHAAIKDPGNVKQLLDTGPPPSPPWNNYVMFINDEEVTNVHMFVRNDRVEFEMVHLDVNVGGTPAKIWVAKVLKKLP